MNDISHNRANGRISCRPKSVFSCYDTVFDDRSFVLNSDRLDYWVNDRSRKRLFRYYALMSAVVLAQLVKSLVASTKLINAGPG